MEEKDWGSYFDKLYKESKIAIDKFAKEHGEEEVSYFCYDSEPCYGYILTCFNTTNESLKYVHDTQKENIKYCDELLSKDAWRNNAYYQVKVNSVTPYCNNAGDFKYQGYTNIGFPEWEKFANSDEYPENPDHEDDYLESRAALIFWKVLQRLADEGAFKKLKLAKPTLLGFGFHDEEQYIVRMLNVPENA